MKQKKKTELSVSMQLLIESESPYSNKSILKSSKKKIFLKDSFCGFKDNGKIKSLLKNYLKCRMFINATYNHISWFWADNLYKVDSVLPGW